MRIYWHSDCLQHDPGAGHPEHPGRLRAVVDTLRTALGTCVEWHAAPLATEAQILRAHTPALLEQLGREIPAGGRLELDEDTRMSAGSWRAARLAAGAICAAVDALLDGSCQRAFCAVRPPGHHALPGRAMGFCLLNAVAIGALHALSTGSVERVAVVDFDVHHGNGTQAILAGEPRALFVSSQQWPLWPGSGSEQEDGGGKAFNGVLAPGSGSAEFRALWQQRLLRALDAFRPQLLLVSAGFDGHRLDPLADLDLVAADYAWITGELVAIAGRHASGRVLSTLEGGYSSTALRECSVAHARALFAGST